ncbi:MAG: T9SS type A sorting domain-containing protein [Ferruginibacter sp.]
MKPNYYKKLSLTISMSAVWLLCFTITNAQICSVNAGVDKIICITQQPLVLSGSVGSSQSSPPVYLWTKLAGPPATIATPASLSTNVTGLTPGNYVFQLSNKCIDGLYAKDIVAITVLPEPPTALAGPDTTFCFNGPIQLSANAVNTPCVGTWTVTPAGGTFFPNANDPHAIYTGLTRSGVRKFTWTVSNGICQKSDVMQVTFVEAATPVNAGRDTTLYCKGKCVMLNASYQGYLPQHGLWTIVSGPNIPVFSNPSDNATKVCSLVPGVYRFRWTVSGPCVNDSDDVVINVINTNTPPNSIGDQNYTNFCENPSVTSELLFASALAPGDSVTWTQIAGGSVATFLPDNHHATITAGNLTGVFPYKFNYIQTNPAGCSVTTIHTLYRSQLITGLTYPADQELPCDVTSTTFNISYNKLNTISNSVVKKAVFVSGPMDTGRIECVTSTVSGLIRTDTWLVEHLTIAGTYIYRLEYGNACGTSFREIAITVSRTPGTVNAGSDIVLPCHGLSITPVGSANAPGIYSWSQVNGPGTATITNANTLIPSLGGLLQGIYTIRLSNWGGNACPLRTDDMNIIVTQLPPLQAIVAADTTICAGNYQLAANTPAATETGTWIASPSTGIAFYPDEHTPNAYVTGLEPNSIYTFTWFVSNVCGSLSSTQNIITGLFVSPPVPDAGNDICATQGTSMISLSGSNPSGANISWTALTPGSIIDTPDQQSTGASVTGGSGAYLFEYALGTTGCGIFRDTVEVIIKSNILIDAGPDINICTEALPYLLMMNGNASSLTGRTTSVWSQLSGPSTATIVDPSNPNTVIENLRSGIYQFEYKMLPANNCEYIADTVTINIATEPSEAIAGPDQSICNATTRTLVYLSANTAISGTGHWQIMSSPAGSPSPLFSDENSPNATLTNLTQGTYHLRWTITNGIACTPKSDDIDININAIANVGNDINLCSVTTIRLEGNPNTNGIWTLISGPNGININAVSGNTAIVSGVVSMHSPAVYTFRYSLPGIGACQSSYDDLVFTNYPSPSTAHAGGDRFLCFNENTITLTGNNPVSGRASWIWQSGPNNPTAGTSNNTANDTVLTNLLPGIYVYQYRINTIAACFPSVETIQIIKQPKANAQADFRICNVSSVNLNANVPLTGQGTWSYISGPLVPMFANIHNPGSAVTGLVPGMYNFRWTVDATGACLENHDDIQVIIDPPVPPANAGNDQQFCQGTVAAFNIGAAASPGVSYNWTPTTMLNSSTVAQPTFQGVNNAGNYVYTVRASIGSCETFSAVNINVRPTPFTNIEVIDSACVASFMASPPGNGVNNPVYNWSFGAGVDPTTASGPGPHQVVFENSGPRTITLEIISADACSKTTSVVFMPYCVLPVKLLSFDAIWKTNYTNVQWKIEDAINLDHFDVERSYDGRTFSFLNRTSYSNYLKDYQYNDHTADVYTNPEVFYRLKMIDADNRFSYSIVKKVKLKNDSKDISVWPNPFTDKILIRYNSAHLPGNVLVKFYNTVGELLLKKSINTEQQAGLLEITNLGSLPPGFYNLQLIADKKIITNHKILKTAP